MRGITKVIERTTEETVSIAADGTTGTFTFKKTGLLRMIKSIASNPTNSITYSIAIKDSDGDQIYSVATLARNATTATVVSELPLCDEEYTVLVTASGVPGTGGFTVGISLVIER